MLVWFWSVRAGSPMLALEIRVNGELKWVCGAQALEQLVGWLVAERNGAVDPRAFDFTLRCQGTVSVDPDANEGLRWVAARMNFGDVVSLKFVDADSVNEPIERKRFPSGFGPPDA